MADDSSKKAKDDFFDLTAQQRAEDEARPKTMLKTTEWGLMTIASLLASFAFPPYFVTVMTLAFLNAGGLLWVTHLSERGRNRLRDFEAEFRHGHHFEEEEKWVEAVGVYLAVKPRYSDVSQLATLCDKRVAKIKREHPEYFPTKASLDRSKKKTPRKTRRGGKSK